MYGPGGIAPWVASAGAAGWAVNHGGRGSGVGDPEIASLSCSSMKHHPPRLCFQGHNLIRRQPLAYLVGSGHEPARAVQIREPHDRLNSAPDNRSPRPLRQRRSDHRNRCVRVGHRVRLRVAASTARASLRRSPFGVKHGDEAGAEAGGPVGVHPPHESAECGGGGTRPHNRGDHDAARLRVCGCTPGGGAAMCDMSASFLSIADLVGVPTPLGPCIGGIQPSAEGVGNQGENRAYKGRYPRVDSVWGSAVGRSGLPRRPRAGEEDA